MRLRNPFFVLKGDVEDPILPPERYRPTQAPAVDQVTLERAARFLAESRRPALLVGGGAIAAQCQPEVLALAEALDAPVATSLRGKGAIPEDHPLALGCLGLYGTRAANSYLRSGIDVLLAVGVSFQEMTTHCWDPSFQPSTALIQVDVDPEEIGKNYPVDLPLVGDARAVLRGLLVALGKSPSRDANGHGELSAFKRANEYFD